MMDEEKIKAMLTPEEYSVLREKGTEAPHSGRYYKENPDGTYVCKVCASPLFASTTKFDSGCGWPSFDQALEGATIERDDSSHGMTRTEVVCAKCESHLGHVFDDGPAETTGRRFCINSISLNVEKE